jgi:hypothetical protein
MVVGVEMVPRTDATQSMVVLALERGKTLNINVLHQVLGHPSEETTRKTASFYGWKVNGTFNIYVLTTKPIASHNQFFEKDLQGLRNIRFFGESGIVNYHADRKIQSKLVDQGRRCVLLGRATNYSNDVYQFLNLSTNRVIISRDILWVQKTYGEWKGLLFDEHENSNKENPRNREPGCIYTIEY